MNKKQTRGWIPYAFWGLALLAVTPLSHGADQAAVPKKENFQTHAQKVHEYRARVARDPQRPKLHFAPTVFWLNDPNGLIQWKGIYHLFYQYDTDQDTSLTAKLPFGRKHWGHATSRDLVHWKNLPIAIAPEDSGPDWGGVWSGSMVINQGVPTAVYTGVTFDPFSEKQCLAVSHDGMRTWQKLPANPVLAQGPPGLPLFSFRDPYVWKEGQSWYMALGSGIQNQGPAVLLFRSPDLLKWEYQRPLIVADKTKHGDVFECPSFFSLGAKQALVMKTFKTVYFTGSWKDSVFTPQYEGDLDLFNGTTAPQVFTDEKGRRIMIAWADEAWNKEAQRQAGWSGLMTLPRVLSLGPDSSIRSDLAEEFTALRRGHRRLGPLTLAPGQANVLPNPSGDPVEILVKFEPTNATRYGVVLRRSPDGKEQTRIVYDAKEKRLSLDRRQSSLDPRATRDIQGGAFSLAKGEPLELRIICDRSIVEVYANHRAAGASRIYPTRADSLGIDLFSEGGTVQVSSVDVWRLK